MTGTCGSLTQLLNSRRRSLRRGRLRIENGEKMSEKNILKATAACDRCGKCVAGCPVQINIPEFFDCTEKFTMGGKPYDCIECGFYTSCCHAGIDVMEIIREIAMEQCVYGERSG